MTIDRIKVSKEFPAGLTSGKWYSMESGINEGDDPVHGLVILEKNLDEAFRLSQSMNGNESLVMNYGDTIATHRPTITNNTNQPLVIQRSYEKLEIQIDNCKSLEELKELKEGLPRDLMSVYMNKLKALTEKI